jgi:sulfatase maturation enzyme AslB (radical SAM superfamily)
MLNKIAIITTMRCDLNCQHCLRGYPKKPTDFPLELLGKLLSQAIPFGAHHIGLTGGEPCLHPEFESIVDKIVAHGYSWHFVSNGQRTAPYLPIMKKYNAKLSHLSLSVDGANAETHDAIRQHKGAFNKVIASLKQYIDLGYKVRISSILNQKNKREVESLIQLAQELGACGISFGGTITTPWNGNLALSDVESLYLYQNLMTFREKTGFDIQTFSSLHTQGGVNFCNILNLSELTFNSLGELIFCCDTIENGAVLDSLRELSFAELINHWLERSRRLQAQRTERIAVGNMGEKFDTCLFCNTHLN